MLQSHQFRRYIVPIVFVVAATGLRYVFNPLLGIRSPHLFHIFAVAMVAEISGTIPGLIATGLSVLAIDYFFVPPFHTIGLPPDFGDRMAVLLFVAVNVVLCIFGGLRKRATDTVRKVHQELERAHERLALKHEIARLGSFELFLLEDRLEWSPQMASMYGIEIGQRVHTLNEWKAMCHPEDADKVMVAFNDAMRKRQATFDSTFRVIQPDNTVRWLHSRGRFEYDSVGRAIHMFGVTLDVTDVKQGELAQQILGDLVQVCSACHRIHDEESKEWYSMEGYLRRRTTTKFSHGMCPDCGKQWFPQA